MPTTDPAEHPDAPRGEDARQASPRGEDARPALPAGPSRRGLLFGAGAVAERGAQQAAAHRAR
ncbi:hypothetical protein E4P35_15090, partial [Thiopseudomonas sp. 4R-3cl]